MLISLILNTLIVSNVGCSQEPGVPTRNFVYDIYDYDTWITVTLNETTEQILDFREVNATESPFPSRVHVTASDDVTVDHPLLLTASQQKGASSWELPLAAGPVLSFDMAHTLCPHDAGPNLTSVQPPRLEVSTSSPRDVTVRIKLRRVNDFYLQLGQERDFWVTAPGTPKYYYFSFDAPAGSDSGSNASVDSILLTIESDSQICAAVSIQNNSCPVFDNEHEIMYQGYHLTMTTKGGITLTREMFPRGFYAVFVVKQSDGQCTGGPTGPAAGNRTKLFRVRAESTPSAQQYWAAAAALLSVPLLVWCCNVLLACCSPEEVLVEELSGIPAMPSEPLVASASVSESDSELSVQAAAQNPSQQQEWAAPTLQQLCRAHPRRFQRQGNRYVWSASTLAVVYTLPVLQLLVTYQNMASSTGDQDLCYYNTWCARPLAGLADANHVMSNLPYVILGAAFVHHVGRAAREARGHAAGLGIPGQHGLMHALGVSLAMEGILSACYHLCPNKMNFQFDSSFMYVMAVLWLSALHRRRLSDSAWPAHRVFALIAGLLVTGVFGIVFPTLWFWIIFTIAHLAASLFITLHLYYYGQLKIEPATLRAAGRVVRVVGWRALLPRATARAAVLLLVNIFNWALAAYGLYWQQTDFARHLLGVLLGNTLLFSLLYVCGKIRAGERLDTRCLALLAASAAAWTVAIGFFLRGHSKWRETPASSRAHNARCLVLDTFDTHDVWHATSAAALYLSFMLLLHIDDPLLHTPRHRIAVF